MDSGNLALWLFGIPCILLAAWAWLVWKLADNARRVQGALHELGAKLKALESSLDAVQAVYDEQFRVVQKACAVGPIERRVDELEQRTAGVEALLVSTVGQETEDFCRKMDAIMDRMDVPEEKQESAPKLTLSEGHVGRFGKPKEATHG